MLLKSNFIINQIISKVKTCKTLPTIIFADGDDKRSQIVAKYLKKKYNLNSILITNKYINESSKIKEYTNQYLKLRRTKINSFAEAKKNILQKHFFAVMTALNISNSVLLSGSNISSAKAFLPILQLCKINKKKSNMTSAMILFNKNNSYVFADCALSTQINIDKLVLITENSYKFVKKIFNTSPKIALLSYSTLGSGKGDEVDLIKSAKEKLNKLGYSNNEICGEVQFDAIFSKRVAKIKNIQNNIVENVNCFIFPNLDSANIGYKIAVCLGKYLALGPFLLNSKIICSDLSRGAVTKEIMLTALCLTYLKIIK